MPVRATFKRDVPRLKNVNTRALSSCWHFNLGPWHLNGLHYLYTVAVNICILLS